MDSILKTIDRVYKVTVAVIKLVLILIWFGCFFVCEELGLIAVISGIVVLICMSVF